MTTRLTELGLRPVEVLTREPAETVLEEDCLPTSHAVALEPPPVAVRARLELEDGTVFEGRSFGRRASTSGEVVFTTGMVGYPETLTDPSYFGQIIVCTYPLVGNYGVPGGESDADGMEARLESWKIHARGLVVADYSEAFSHWEASRSLAEWLDREGISAITGVDTRALTKRLRERGSMLGRLVVDGEPVDMFDPNHMTVGPLVSVKKPVLLGAGNDGGRVALVDCGCKHNIARSLLARGLEVLRVPWDFDLSSERLDGVMLSNGPGDPTTYAPTIAQVRGAIERGTPTMGVCLGNQLLALAIGAKTFKLKYGHRGQNQPVIEVGTHRCALTSQNHGFAVDSGTLPKGWSPWYENLNDGTNEGIRHSSGRFRSVQFHPEANPGPVDTAHLFDEFVDSLDG
ncbi:MAG TPA: carbamoyl-phosphate synthase (glutamine-hydrolyzing) small subunit [Phycisphaerales bacterium]|nr:carbamoyl-phosphate synthase (glutamine-hydrolyzing) small subunit [Phycisphaerales bacterium]